MGADRWRVCLKCAKTKTAEQEDRLAFYRNAYGKVSEAEYAELTKEINSFTPVDLDGYDDEDCTFPEYYEIYIDGKTEELIVDYGGTCRVCGWKVNYRHKEKLEI